jgi:cytochrome c oxidase subunit 3
MWLFVASDAATFAVLLLMYLHVRMATAIWPAPFHVWPAILMTAILLSSSFTIMLAVNASRKGNPRRAARFVLLTIAGGIAFLLLHLNEWATLIRAGIGLTQNPWGIPMVGGTFFPITGLHMLHVLGGVLYLGAIARGVGARHAHTGNIEVSAIYWQFVDIVWLFIFPLFYLLPGKAS